jgi:hypothetical protein
MYEIAKTRIAMERHPDSVMNFEEWKVVDERQ